MSKMVYRNKVEPLGLVFMKSLLYLSICYHF